MTIAPCNSDAAQLLPWFVTGRLDLHHERALRDVVRTEDRTQAPDAARGFEKLMARIGETEHALPTESPARKPVAVRRVRFPRWVGAAVLAHALALGLVGAALWRHTDRIDEAPFRTLTTDTGSTALGRAHLRVVFAPGTTTQELAGILDLIDARIVDGPSPAGAYALALSGGGGDAAAVRTTLARLRADARVILAEPLQAEPAP